MSRVAEIRVIAFLFAAILTGSTSTPAWSDDSTGDGATSGHQNDFPAAIHLLRPLAERGDAEAQYRVGQMFEEAHDVSHSGADALKWYRLAADQGHASAQYSLGRLYVIGRDISQDYVQAYKWFILAEVGFPEFDRTARARAIKAREVISPMMTPAQIAEAHKLAKK